MASQLYRERPKDELLTRQYVSDVSCLFNSPESYTYEATYHLLAELE